MKIVIISACVLYLLLFTAVSMYLTQDECSKDSTVETVRCQKKGEAGGQLYIFKEYSCPEGYFPEPKQH